jgi:hypothetical protein
MSEKTINVHKVTLGTKKQVVLREMLLEHQELAMRAVGDEPNPNIFQYKTNLELLKILLLEVDGQKIDQTMGVSLQKHLTLGEIQACLKFINKVSGGDEANLPLIEHSVQSFGAK